jgi:hypothetical protein
VHADWGVVDIEVKGHRLRVRDGVWCSGSRRSAGNFESPRMSSGMTMLR